MKYKIIMDNNSEYIKESSLSKEDIELFYYLYVDNKDITNTLHAIETINE